MKSAVENGKLGREEELSTLKRLDADCGVSRPLPKVLHSKLLWNVSGQSRRDNGGRSVFGWEEALKKWRAQ